MQGNLRYLVAVAGFVMLAACTNPVQSAAPETARYNGGSMGSGGRGGTVGDTTYVVSTTSIASESEECYEESFNGGSMGSGGFVIVPCPEPAK